MFSWKRRFINLGGITHLLKIFLSLTKNETEKVKEAKEFVTYGVAEFGCISYILEILSLTVLEYGTKGNEDISPIPTNSTLSAALHSAIPLVFNCLKLPETLSQADTALLVPSIALGTFKQQLELAQKELLLQIENENSTTNTPSFSPTLLVTDPENNEIQKKDEKGRLEEQSKSDLFDLKRERADSSTATLNGSINQNNLSTTLILNNFSAIDVTNPKLFIIDANEFIISLVNMIRRVTSTSGISDFYFYFYFYFYFIFILWKFFLN